MSSGPTTLERVRTILRRDLRLGADVDIPDQMPLSGGQADIDSLDILLLFTSIEREFGIKIPSQSVTADDFKTVAALVAYVDTQVRRQGVKAAPSPAPAAPPSVDYLARLPHGEGFRFISRVVDIRPGDAGHAVWSVQGQEPFFAGHFPGRPLVPGVLIAEALAQLSGLVAAPPAGSQGKLAHLDLRFEESVAPPAQIELRSKLTRAMGALYQFDVTAAVGPNVVARGSLALALSAPGSAT